MKPEVLDYEILTQTRALIADPKHWVRGAPFAKWINGQQFACALEIADSFCILGALSKVLGINSALEIRHNPAFHRLIEAMGGDPISYNDRHTHGEVLAMVDKALALTMARMK